MNLHRRVLLLLAAMLMVGCDEAANAPLSLSHGEDGQTRMSFAMPGLLQHRAIDPDQVSLVVSVNDTAIQMTNGPTGWTGSLQLQPGSPWQLDVLWREQIGGDQLSLAAYRESRPAINSSLSLEISNNDYEVESFDKDDDGVSNLAERVDGSSPFDPLDPADGGVDVSLPAIDPSDAPVIDGSYDAIWNSARYVDQNRQDLRIDNLMIDQGAIQADGESGYRWGGMHDGVYLYLFVLGEGEEGSAQTPFGDSLQFFEDDTLEIFWDGDNSKARSYDGIDDFQILIPLLKFGEDPDVNKSGDADTRFRSGSNSLEFPESAVDFAVCKCSGASNTWEIRLRLSEARIQLGRTFGFEIQLDDDRDGGARDVKWGWDHPSRNGTDVDNTWTDPSFMGTARLNPAR